MRALSICLIVSCLALQSACSVGLPRVHRVTVQQGNVITQDMIDRLKPGMTRSQVAFVMGEPVLRHAFNDNRWDYIYTLQIPGYYDEQKRVSLYFENGVLAYFTGDYAPTSAQVEDGEQSTARVEGEEGADES
jgi:outer membrane protein assembly factor BamE